MLLAELASARSVLIYGYGLEGRSTARFIGERYPAITVEIHDNYIAEFNTPKALASYDVVIVSPGVPRDLVAGVSPARITSQTEIFFANLTEQQRRSVIGISGTNGKSTTATFCAEMLTNAGRTVGLGGNIAHTLLELLGGFADGRYDHIVAELSSFQLEHLTVSPGIAVFLNITPEHLAHHKSFDKYLRAKANLWRYQRSSDVFVASETTRRVIATHCRDVHFAAPMADREFSPASSFRAQHFRRNLGTMVTLARLLDIPDEVVEDTTRAFQGLPHRLECFAEVQGITFCDDSAATNVGATRAAVEALAGRIGSLILGGVNPGVSYEPLVEAVAKYAPEAHLIIMESEVKDAIVSAVEGQGLQYNLAGDLAGVVRHAFAETPAGTVCVLSPAAKSFDWFKDYHDRGESFKREVLATRRDDAWMPFSARPKTASSRGRR
jgi:UDP-N-acetylmuramoylalanine--D-glutamate ligase